MTFLEAWLAISPDGGNGAAEATLAGGLLLLVASYWAYRRRSEAWRARARRLLTCPAEQWSRNQSAGQNAGGSQ